MRLEWLEDLLAVIDTGSFHAAAKKRLVTQPAFSRRIRAIEDYVGVELFDRTHKPVQLGATIRDREPAIRELAANLRDLVSDFRQRDRDIQNRIVIASQHAITTARAPELVKALSAKIDVGIRLRSANRDECFALLLTKQADLLITYRADGDALPVDAELLERIDLGVERLIPVLATASLEDLNQAYARGTLPIVAYPGDAFLGRVFTQQIAPHLRAGGNAGYVRRKVETALTVAALQFAIAGVGVAWVPATLAATDIASGILTDMSDVLPATELLVAGTRLPGSHSSAEEHIWAILQQDGVSARITGSSL